jgi:CspA family cold shock protein
MKGTVKWFNNQRGYGFIKYGDEDEIFIHYTGIDMDGYKSLLEGQKVTFDIVEGARGPQATNVVPLEDDEGLSNEGLQEL